MLAHQLGDRASLRLLEEHDADELYAVIDRERAHLSRWMPWPPAQTRERTLDFIRRSRRQLADNDGLQTALIVDGAIAGMIGLHAISWENRSTSIGYWLAERHQGHGHMTAAVRAYLGYVFDTLKLNRLELAAAPDNARSRAIAQRLGFREEGARREAERRGERFHDLVVYSLLAGDRA